MREVSVKEYAELAGIRTQSVYRQIKASKLVTKKRDGVTYVLTDKEQSVQKVESQSYQGVQQSATETLFLREQIEHLNGENNKLKNRVDALVESKELLLVEERRRIERIYQEKDQQLKQILSLINTKLLAPNQSDKGETLNAEFVDSQNDFEAELEDEKLIELDYFLKYQGMDELGRKIISKRFELKVGRDKRVIRINNKFYLDLEKFDYKTLLSFT